MMNFGNPTYVGWRSFLTITIVLVSLSTSAYCQGSDITLFVQQTPDGGGATNPTTGIYHFQPQSEVTLTATPSPGYQFVYWLGDVSNREASSTVVHLDKPKIVIAVFEQSDYNFSGVGAPGGGSGLTRTAGNLSIQSGINASAGSRPQVYSLSGDTEVPEPATGVLLILGGLFVLTKRRKKIKPSRS
ncbi:MAG: PEP-CTERM sorting domain-containing protein [Sedimentisphaerales bacterium]|nr:PEP-CTERM sorting domain-containing protein [Sedimentisphaerales bacterium]